LMYHKGQGVPQNSREAVRWYRLAATQGDAGAQFNLGLMYHKGQGVIQDYKEAVRWYRLAATQGNTKAHYSLGLMHDRGHGVIRNNVYAHMWFNIAAISDGPNAVKARSIVSGKMTAADISKAQDLARDCVRKNYNAC
jgi:TPR repeat protein